MITDAIGNTSVIIAVFLAGWLFLYIVLRLAVAYAEMRSDPTVRRIMRGTYGEPTPSREAVPQFLKRHRFPHRCPKGGHDDADAWLDCEAEIRKEMLTR